MNPALPQAVIIEMARREMRLHQLLWREIRRYWNQYPRDVQDKITELGWAPPRPAADENEAPLFDNDAGEDFFYMNRQLIRRVNRILTEVGDPDYPQVEGWITLPGPDNPDFPVPPAWFDPGSHPIVNRYIARIKTDIVYRRHLVSWERIFTDPNFLKGVTLGTLGGLVDYYLMNPFRRRWAAAPGAMRPAVGPEEASSIGTEWDDLRYDFLSDYYSMQVNPIYWRFAGWIDDRLEEWKYANGVFGDDFWVGRWVGVLPEAQPQAARADAPTPQAETGGSTLEDVARVIAGTGLSSLQDIRQLDLDVADGTLPGGPSDGGGPPTNGHDHGATR
jgi:hypothetical protein